MQQRISTVINGIASKDGIVPETSTKTSHYAINTFLSCKAFNDSFFQCNIEIQQRNKNSFIPKKIEAENVVESNMRETITIIISKR